MEILKKLVFNNQISFYNFQRQTQQSQLFIFPVKNFINNKLKTTKKRENGNSHPSIKKHKENNY